MAWIDAHNILAHRGLWHSPSEQNSEIAFIRALESGFGIETDLREHNGELALSHDPISKGSICLKLARLRQLIIDGGFYSEVIALNVKSDGLQRLVESILDGNNAINYFFFDFSVPDGVVWMKRNHPYFTRISKYEQYPALYDRAVGVWVDCFDSDWNDFATLDAMGSNKSICFVSPELHGRQPHRMWAEILTWLRSSQNQNVMLCTDFPELARDFFA